MHHHSEMGRRRRMQSQSDGPSDGAFPIQYLLPIQPPPTLDDDGAASQDGFDCNGLDELNLYRQAVPLLHPQSTSAARTIGKMLGSNKIAERILQRNQPTTSVQSPSPAPNALRRLQFHKTCEDIFVGFDPIVKRTKRLPLHRMRLLLHHYSLEVDEVAFRQWEQSLPAECKEVSLVAFLQACTQWFHEQFLIDHYAAWRQEQHAAVVLGKCQSAPHLLHPFDALARRDDDAQAFSYEEYAHSPPPQFKTQNETCASKSHALISATQELRRNTKILTRLSSSPSLPTPDTQTPVAQPVPTHDRLHDEKLARHILQRCGSQALAPSNRRKSSATIGALTAITSQPPNAHTIKLKQQAAKKLLRQQNAETTKAFSASIAMISRHVHDEELRDLREIAYEKQVAIVDERKQLRRLQHAHCKALAQEKAHQQLRDVAAMRTVAEEESEITRQYLECREQMLRFQKPQFTLSSSTSTLFQQPPEILAAKATAKTNAQKKRLQQMEKEHLDHMRSIQLLDYVYDKKRAIEDANEPRADAALLDLQVEQLPTAQETALATQELWHQIIENCQDSGDLTPLIPPPNSPPAALRYFAPGRTGGFLPPFTASTVTPSVISKVP